MRVVAGTLLWILVVGPAAAHGPTPLPPDSLWHRWNFDPLVLVPLLAAGWLYPRGLRNLWIAAGRRRGVTYFHATSFALGMAMLFCALVSPLDALGGTLLCAHMAQHGLLIAAAPPLLLAGKPGVAFAWALPSRRRRNFLVSTAWHSLARMGNVLSRPLPAAALHGLTLWLWHAPAVFDQAIAGYAMHAFEHICFFGTALLFWRSILGARSPRRAGVALCATFATLVHSGLLGALITMAPYPIYAWYAGRTQAWGLGPLEDQQLAGLLMWVPMGLVYLGGCLALASRLAASPPKGAPRSAAIEDAWP
jgi:putative membrane protein